MLFSGRPLRILQGALLALQEIAWINAWSALLGFWLADGRALPLLPFAAVAPIYIAGSVITSLSVRYIRRPRLYQLLVAVLGVAIAFVVALSGGLSQVTHLRDRALLMGALALFLWWRGILLGRSGVTTDDVQARFRLAVIMLAALFLLDVVVAPEGFDSTGLLTVSSLAALFAGLIGLPLANVVDLSEMTRYHAGAPAVNRQWFGMLLGATVGLLALTLLITSALSFERLRALFSPIGGAVNSVVMVLVYAIAVPVGLALEFLLYLFRSFVHPSSSPRPKPPSAQSVLDHIRHSSSGGVEGAWLFPLKIAIAVVIVVGLIWLLSRALSRLGDRRQRDTADEERDFVWSWAALGSGIVGWLRRLFGRGGATTGTIQAIPSAPRDALRRDPAGVREMYREFLALSARRVRGRRVSETPMEYVVALERSESFRDVAGDSETLTGVYQLARYDSEEPSADEVAAARRSLERIRRSELPGEGSSAGSADHESDNGT